MSDSPTNNASAIADFLGKYQTLQTLPENGAAIMRMSADPNCNAAELVKLIEKDAVVAAAIMKAVNSAFYSLASKITRIDRAVAYLGLKTVKQIATSACLSKMCKWVSFGPFTARDLWDHGMAVAIASRELAIRSKAFDGEEVFLLGVLHDIGLILAAQSEQAKGTELLTLADDGKGAFGDLEQKLFGFTHAELGAALARKWSFQESHIGAVQFHHHPAAAPEELRPLCNHLYVADTIVCRSAIGCPLSGKGQPLESVHLKGARITAEMVDEVTKKLPLLVRLHFN